MPPIDHCRKYSKLADTLEWNGKKPKTKQNSV